MGVGTGITGPRVGGQQNPGAQNPIMGPRQINPKIRTSVRGQGLSDSGPLLWAVSFQGEGQRTG